MRKIKKYICFLLILSNVFVLSGCSKNEDDLLISKLESEMKYFDFMFSNMLNETNGINFQNYQIKTEKIKEPPSSSESKQSSQETGESKQDESSKGDSSSDNVENQSEQEQSKQNNVKYEMVENNILTKERNTDWKTLTNDIEIIYSNWSVMTLDLYKKNVNNKKILSFNTDLDELAKAIKDKNKSRTLSLLAKLYSYIPIYSTEFSDNQMQTNLYKVKSNVFNAYSIIEQNNSEEVKKHLQLAEESIVAMMNNMGTKNQKEYNVNKVYILLKDMQNTIDKNDIDIFYLKYKNLIEELNSL